jgi:tetratricopeptide (TPR) repeat protein
LLRADDLNNKAVSLLDQGKREEAKKLLEQALNTDPHHLLANYNYGLLMWREGEATDLEFFKPLEDAVFGQPSPGNYLLGLMHMARGELELALECLKKAIQLSPDESDYQNVLGLVYFGLGNYAKSTQCFKKVVEGEPSNWRYQVNLTTSLLSEGIKEEAKKHLSRALSNQQGFLGVSSWLGISPTKDIETIIPLLHKVNVPLPRLLKTFKGHARGIVSVCFSSKDTKEQLIPFAFPPMVDSPSREAMTRLSSSGTWKQASA